MTEPVPIRRLLVSLTLLIVGVLLMLPLGAVLFEAFRDGIPAWIRAVRDPETLAALSLSLRLTLAAVPLSALFGLAAAWCLTKYRIPGDALFHALLDLPLAISPVVIGLALVLTWGPRSPLGRHLPPILFAFPGMLLAVLFVTFPYVARELIPLMTAQGTEEEEAAALTGAGFFCLLRRVTLPNVRWALFHGFVLAAARSLGEFGAVSIVSGHIRGRTLTLPLLVEMFYNEYRLRDAFAVASLLTLTALLTLAAKSALSRRIRYRNSLRSTPKAGR